MAIVSDVEIRLRADIARLQQDLTRARGQVSSFTSGVKGMVGGLFAGMGVGAVVSQIVTAQREFEKLRASLVTVTGSSQAAGKAFEAIQKFAAATPYSVQEVTEGFLKLRNLGLTPSERALMSYGNTASAMGKSLNQMVEAVADAATGEFERLKEFGVKAKQNGDQVSLTFQGVKKTIGNNAAEIEAYLMAIGEVQFAGGMSRQADTLDGDLSNLGDTWDQTLVAFSQSGFGDVVRGSIQALSGSLSDLGAMFKAVSSAADEEGGKVEAIGPLHKFLTTVFEALTVTGVNVAYVFKTIGKDIGAFAAEAVTLFNGGFKGLMDGSTVKAIKGISNARAEEAKRERAEVDATSARILGAAAKNQAARAKEAEDRKNGVADALEQYKIQSKAAKELSDKQKKAAEDAAKAEAKRVQSYRELESRVQARVDSTARELAGLSELSEAEKFAIQLTEDIRLGKEKLTKTEEARIRSLNAEAGANAVLSASNKEYDELMARLAKNAADAAQERESMVESARQEAEQNEWLLKTYGLTEIAIVRLEAARMREQMVRKLGRDLTAEEIADLQRVAELKERNALALGGLELQEFLDPTKAESFGDALRGAFGAAGDAAKQLIGTLNTYGEKQAAIDKARKLAASSYGKDSKQYAAVSAALTAKETRDRVSAYGDMAGAAKGFFKEGSKGYTALETAEKAFRAYELALSMETMLKKIFFKETEVAANVALNATKVSGEAAASAASTTLAGTEASAWGITAVVKAIASLPFPMNLAAGAATLAAVVALGAKVMGGMGSNKVSVSEQRQKTQGTGSVFGDPDAKSESIVRALEMVEKNTYQGLTVSMGMLTALTAIKNSMGSFAALVVRDGAITGGAPGSTGYDSLAKLSGVLDGAGGGLSGIAAKISNAIFGGKKTLEDTGFTIGKTTLEAIANGGLNALKYADIKKDGGWFSKDKFSTTTAGIGEEGNRRITALLMSLADGVKAAGAVLGIPADEFTEKLNGFVVDIGKISFKDMKPDEIEAAVQAVFSKLGDQMAQFAAGGLEPFQKVGEGYLETLTRVAQGYETVDVVMRSMGMAFNSVGFGSVAARERLIELSGGLEQFAQRSETFLKEFFTETEQADALRARVQPMLDQYGLRASGEGAVKALRDYVVGLDTTTEAGAQAYAIMMQLAPAIKQIADAERYIFDERKDLQDQLDELTMTAAQLRDKERAAIHESNRAIFDQIAAFHDQAAAAEVAKEAADRLAESMAQSLRDNEEFLNGFADTAMSALGRAVDAQKDRVTESHKVAMAALEKHVGRVNTTIQRTGELSKALRGAVSAPAGDSAMRGQVARAEITAALAIARSSGVLPSAESLAAALSTVTQDNSDDFATFQEYQRAVSRTNAELEALGGLSDKELSNAERQLQVLESQKESAERAYQAELQRLDALVSTAQAELDAIHGVDNSVKSVDETLRTVAVALSALRSGATAAKPGGVNAFSGNLTVEELYRKVLGRDGEAAGVAFWKKAFGDTVDQNEYLEFMKGAQTELSMPKAPPMVATASGTMAGSSALNVEQQQINARMEANMARTATAVEQLAQQFNQVSAGGNALATESI